MKYKWVQSSTTEQHQLRTITFYEHVSYKEYLLESTHNSPPSHMTLPLEYRTPILSGIQDESSIQVFGIQMVTVV